VWSHGQGGRPEAVLAEGYHGGFNICLHNRYAAIAKRLGFSSYWMDTPCIPEDHELRGESIAHINTVFTESKITLVCDRDLMEIDIKPLLDNPDGISESLIRLRESIIATILVCDWNVRSWALLESMRGRKNIHFLCRNNEVVQLKKILEMVCQYGSIDLAILFLSSQHMLPAVKHEIEAQYFPARDTLEEVTQGFIPIQEATCLLGNRHASREDDDIVIWSLLTGAKPYYNARELWCDRINTSSQSINTGFLLSSVPRLCGVKGLSWAPRQPTFHSSPNSVSTTKTYQAYDG
jgi:hypothetical protein